MLHSISSFVKKRSQLIFCSVALIVSVSPLQAAIRIDGFISNANDRFANNASFIANAFDLSGVGRSNDSKWGTLISNNVFLSATHSRPSINSTLTFFETNDSTGNSISRTVTSGMRIGSSDIWIGVLDTPVTSAYSTYSFATTAVSNSTEFAATPYAGTNAYLFGLSPTAFPTTTNVAVGRNVLDGWFNDVTAGGSTDSAIVSVVNESGDTNFVSSEAHLSGGDSGAPMFFDDSGDLLLVGINWFIGQADTDPGPDENLIDINGFSYIGNYSSDIQDFIALNAVPEPSLAAVILGASSFLYVRRRKSILAKQTK